MDYSIQVYQVLDGKKYDFETIVVDRSLFDYLLQGCSDLFKKQPMFSREHFEEQFKSWYNLNCLL